jgi:FKBP-type peptidyl-prolyl cis-trans isomerase SlyD
MVILQQLKNVKMKIDKNCVISFSYEMAIVDENGNKNQQIEKTKPLSIVAGSGNLLESFEKHLFGLSKNDSFEFILESDQTYGPYLDHAIHEFELKELLDGTEFSADDLEPGIYLPMETDEGTPFNGKIIEIKDHKALLDFNHPLAGKDLFFKGQILDVRKGSPHEIESGKVLQESENSFTSHEI